MAIRKETISKYIYDSNVRKEGQRIFVKNQVRNLSVDIKTENNFEITAVVIDERKAYRTSVSVEGMYVRCQCDCSRYGMWGGCRHTAATLYQYCDEVEKGTVKRSTSESIKNLMYDYAVMTKRNVFKKKVEGNVELIPILTFSYGVVGLKFKVGIDHKYVIKDLQEFADNVRDGEDFSYGKKLRFVHDRSAFSKESLPLVDFLMESIANYNNAILSYEGYRKEKTLKTLNLSCMELDKFMNIMMNKRVYFSIYDKERFVQIREENPIINFYMRKVENGAMVSRDNMEIMWGEERAYCLSEEYIYASTSKFKKEMQIILESITANREEYVAEEDMSAFTAAIVPVFEKYGAVLARGIELEKYAPAQTQLEIYLDTENMKVTCTIWAVYGDKKYNLFDKFNPVETYRDIKTEGEIFVLGQRYFKEDASNGYFFIENDDDDLYEFLVKGLDEMQQLGEVFVSDAFNNMKVYPTPKVSFGVSIDSDLLYLDVDMGDFPKNQLLQLLDSYKKKKKYHRLKSGEFISLEESSFSTLAELSDGLMLTNKQLQEGSFSVPSNRALYVDKVLRESNENVEYTRDSYFRTLVRNIKAMEDSEYEVPACLKSVLREYQKTGYRWLRSLNAYGFGGILADDMGLGKTVQVIALLLSIKEEKGKISSIIVCPASLVFNWEREIKRFAPDLDVAVISGSATVRSQAIDDYENKDVLVTSYDLLKRDIEAYSKKKFDVQIIDEAQYIKNPVTQAAKAVKEITATTKFALTGTPIENRLSELWSIFDYLMPGMLFSYTRFKNDIEIPIVSCDDPVALTMLHRIISPFILRRLKKDVLKDLPEKLEDVIYAKMEEEQERLYVANVMQLKDSIDNKSDSEFRKDKIQILSQLTRLRQICCDPSLFYDDYNSGSAKLDVCMDLIENGVDSGHKILLFSQFTSMLDIVAKRLESSDISYYMLTGQTTKAKRQQLVENFNENDTSVFLISLKAGGTGLNLTSADIVIHYDPWWNIAAQNQATDRAHRIGQKNVVTVYKLIAKDSIEEKIMQLQEMKKDLADSIISGEEIASGKLNREDLLELLS